MKNKNGFYLIDILIGITIFLLTVNISFVYIKKINEDKEIKKAKTLICETFTTYTTKAFYGKETYYVNLDYSKKEITVFKSLHKPITTIKLPKSLKYTTIFHRQTQENIFPKITKNGNISPSFSIYIFGSDNIARYRISFYGFDIIKYLKINVYRNRKDKRPTYDNILIFHKSWTRDNILWIEE